MNLAGWIAVVLNAERVNPAGVSALRAFWRSTCSNVFGMTRFPDEQDELDRDPLAVALDAIREAWALHGLEFHLASDRMIVDDLWANVAPQMWACRYGIAFFEDRKDRGINYNLTIEVGTAGPRRAAGQDGGRLVALVVLGSGLASTN